MARDRKRQQDTDLQERVVYIHRVSKTVKGPLAIQKGIEDAKKNMFHVPVTEHGSIPHTVEGHGMTVGEMFVGKEN